MVRRVTSGAFWPVFLTDGLLPRLLPSAYHASAAHGRISMVMGAAAEGLARQASAGACC